MAMMTDEELFRRVVKEFVRETEAVSASKPAPIPLTAIVLETWVQLVKADLWSRGETAKPAKAHPRDVPIGAATSSLRGPSESSSAYMKRAFAERAEAKANEKATSNALDALMGEAADRGLGARFTLRWNPTRLRGAVDREAFYARLYGSPQSSNAQGGGPLCEVRAYVYRPCDGDAECPWACTVWIDDVQVAKLGPCGADDTAKQWAAVIVKEACDRIASSETKESVTRYLSGRYMSPEQAPPASEYVAEMVGLVDQIKALTAENTRLREGMSKMEKSLHDAVLARNGSEILATNYKSQIDKLNGTVHEMLHVENRCECRWTSRTADGDGLYLDPCAGHRAYGDQRAKKAMALVASAQREAAQLAQKNQRFHRRLLESKGLAGVWGVAVRSSPTEKAVWLHGAVPYPTAMAFMTSARQSTPDAHFAVTPFISLEDAPVWPLEQDEGHWALAERRNGQRTTEWVLPIVPELKERAELRLRQFRRFRTWSHGRPIDEHAVCRFRSGDSQPQWPDERYAVLGRASPGMPTQWVDGQVVPLTRERALASAVELDKQHQGSTWDFAVIPYTQDPPPWPAVAAPQTILQATATAAPSVTSQGPSATEWARRGGA
jgi:hypothetical protein